METWFQTNVLTFFENVQNMSQKCEQFLYGIFGGYVWDFWSPYVAEASLGRAQQAPACGDIVNDSKSQTFKVFHPFNISNVQSFKMSSHVQAFELPKV